MRNMKENLKKRQKMKNETNETHLALKKIKQVTPLYMF